MHVSFSLQFRRASAAGKTLGFCQFVTSVRHNFADRSRSSLEDVGTDSVDKAWRCAKMHAIMRASFDFGVG